MLASVRNQSHWCTILVSVAVRLLVHPSPYAAAGRDLFGRNEHKISTVIGGAGALLRPA